MTKDEAKIATGIDHQLGPRWDAARAALAMVSAMVAAHCEARTFEDRSRKSSDIDTWERYPGSLGPVTTMTIAALDATLIAAKRTLERVGIRGETAAALLGVR